MANLALYLPKSSQPFQWGWYPHILVLVVVAFLSSIVAHTQPSPPEATPQRPTFTNDTATTAPGTLEFDFGAAGPASTVMFPTTIKFTPPAEKGFFHQMEFSLGLNSMERVAFEGGSEIKFGDALNFVVRRPVWNRDGFSFAVAPQVQVFIRDDSGALLGGKAIAVYAFGLNSLVINVAGAGATSRPGWVSEIATGFGRALGDSGIANRISVAFEMLNSFSQGEDAVLSLLQALNYRVRPGLVFDLAVEQKGLRSGEFEMVLMGGVTCNIGRIWR